MSSFLPFPVSFWVADGSRTSNGVLQPYRSLGWWRWMYHLSPYTYVVEALMGNGKNFSLDYSP